MRTVGIVHCIQRYLLMRTCLGRSFVLPVSARIASINRQIRNVGKRSVLLPTIKLYTLSWGPRKDPLNRASEYEEGQAS